MKKYIRSSERADLPDLPYPYSIDLRRDGSYHITSRHPYDLTDYAYAISETDDIYGIWKIYEPNPRYSIYMPIGRRPAQNIYIGKCVGVDEAISKLMELDSTKKPRIDRT